VVDCSPTALAVMVITAVPPFGDTVIGVPVIDVGVKLFPVKLVLFRVMLLPVPFVTVMFPKPEPPTAADIKRGFGVAVNCPFPPEVLPGVNDTLTVADVNPDAVKVTVAVYVVPFCRPAVLVTETVRVSGVVKLFTDWKPANQFDPAGLLEPYVTEDTAYKIAPPVLVVTLTCELIWFDVKVSDPLLTSRAWPCAGKGIIAARAAIRKQAVLLNENSGSRAASMVSPDPR
jgi:hypothetical protein